MENEGSVINSIYFVLNNKLENVELKVIHKIKLYEIKNLNDISSFNAWWDIIIKKIGHYENNTSKIHILFILNIDNTIKNFNVSENNVFFLKPIFPWKNEIVDYYEEQFNLIKKYEKYILKNIKNK